MRLARVVRLVTGEVGEVSEFGEVDEVCEFGEVCDW